VNLLLGQKLHLLSAQGYGATSVPKMLQDPDGIFPSHPMTTSGEQASIPRPQGPSPLWARQLTGTEHFGGKTSPATFENRTRKEKENGKRGLDPVSWIHASGEAPRGMLSQRAWDVAAAISVRLSEFGAPGRQANQTEYWKTLLA